MLEQAKRLKELECKKTRLKKILADLSLEKAMLKKMASETGKPHATA
jgi:hypothetical protein